MRRKWINAVILILSVVVLGVIIAFWTIGAGNKKLSELVGDSAQIQEIIDSRTRSEYELFEDIRFDGFSLTHDEVNNKWYYSLIDESTSAYNPYVVINSDRKVNIIFKDTVLDDRLIAANEPIQFVVYTDEEYMESEVVCTTLPLIDIKVVDSRYEIEDNTNIDYDSTDPNSITDSGEPIKFEDTDIVISVFNNQANMSASSRVVTSDARAHIRGNSSTFYDKKSYKVELIQESVGQNIRGNDVSLLGMRADDDWILYAAATEGSRLRNVFSSNLWTVSCGDDNPYQMANGTEGTYAEVFINGEYWGLYALMYPIDSLRLSLKNTGDSKTSDHYYRSNEISGEPFKEFQKELVPDTIWNFQYYGAEDIITSEEQMQPLNDFAEILRADDDTFLREYKNYVYLDNALDMWLFIKFALAVDNLGNKNINFIAKYDEKEQRYVILFSPWDMDMTWGYMYVKGHPDYEDMLDMYCTGISRLLALDTENTIVLLRDRYKELRNGVWSAGSVHGVLDPLVEDIWCSGAMYREAERWPTDNPWQQLTDIDAAGFKDYVDQQLLDMDGFMDCQLVEYADKMKRVYEVE